MAESKSALVLKNKVASVRDLLIKHQAEIVKASPVDLVPERIARCAINQCLKNQALLDCSPQSFLQAVSDCAQYGLYPDAVAQEAHLIPYAGKCTLVIGYMGLIKLAKRPGDIRSIWAKAVYQGDQFEYEYGLNSRLIHVPVPASKRGNLRAVYAVVHFKDGYKEFAVLEDEDVLKVKKFSLAKKKNIADSPWTQWEEAMWCKTAIRALCKSLPKSPELERALAQDREFELAEEADYIDAEPVAETETGTQESAEKAKEEPIVKSEPSPAEKETQKLKPAEKPKAKTEAKSHEDAGEPQHATDIQLRNIASIGKSIGLTDEQMRQVCTIKTGRKIESRKELSSVEANMIKELFIAVVEHKAAAQAELRACLQPETTKGAATEGLFQ